ncbi:sensor histidine kinase [Sinorhizobium alkalisoli]|uniref:Signal transduction histidine-protein kinase/phosphatase MprB n=1 Tax=Sinorhizobium alkalisoli TaxID=1752398 RepID=A0A1E3VHD2_9HYPH|nr:HAMP domain-containing sensor histidine kinase [Sinorhizobium alkalisoli]ODR92999.1 two-component sensor histidine kinase [Sinorhizobium alkalisoli]
MTRAPRIRRKWRPTLALVVYSVLLAVMALPGTILIWFRAVENDTDTLAATEAGALVIALVFTLGVAYVLTRSVTGPIEALIGRTEEIARGGRAALKPLERYGTREIATLSQSFLDLASELVDRSDYVRSFAAHVCHELKSPLTAIRGAAELLIDDDTEAPMSRAQSRRFLENILADAERLDHLLVRLRELAQAELPAMKGQTTVAEVTAELSRRFQGLEVTSSGDVETPIALPREALAIALANIAENADQHGASRLGLAASCGERTLALFVIDDGAGIAEGNRDLIFQPFFSTRRESGGTGMGLAITQAMLASHGGTIRLVDTGGRGAGFELVLPIAA